MIKSFYEKLGDVTVDPETKVITHNLLKNQKGEIRTFKDEATFAKWKKRHERDFKDRIKQVVSPHQFYVTQGMGTERPFTGKYWWNKDPGMYECVCCT